MAEESKLFEKRVGRQSVILQENTAQIEKILDEQTKSYKNAVEKQQDLVKQSLSRIAAFKQQGNIAAVKAEEKHLKELNKLVLEAEADLAQQRTQLRQKAIDTANLYEQNKYKSMTAREKLEYQKKIAEQAKTDKKALQEKYAVQQAEHDRLNRIINSKTASESEKADAIVKRTALVSEKRKTRSELDRASKIENTSSQNVDKLFDSVATKSEKAKKASEDYDKAEKARFQAAAEAESALREYHKALENNSDPKLVAELEKEYDAKEKLAQETEKSAKAALKHKDATEKQAKAEKTLEEKRAETIKSLSRIGAVMGSAIDTSLNNLYGQQGKMMGRLQGTDLTWQKAVDTVSSNIGFSGIASQQKVVEKMVQLVDSGVAYNLEMRAFLAETSENIAATFNAFDSNLLRLIRLQQADTTAERLGMEATLTKLFNSAFQDSSYLAESISDAVASAILDANATMSRDDSLQFEYVVQKWLGSLYSLGMSSETVTGIAQGINYLATGNVTALSNNPSLQTLFSLSANRTKKSYADMLVGGISAEETNDLLKSMVEILSEISSDSSNRVTSSAYAELFNMSLTDLRTFQSLTQKELQNIYNSTVNYEGLRKETETQLTQIWSRKNVSQIVDTVIENAMTGTAQNIGAFGTTYGLWKALNLVDSLVDMEIPGLTAVGTGTTSAIDVINIAKLGFAGMGLVTSMIEAIASGSGGGANLSAWNFKETTTRGNTLPVLPVGSASTISYSASMGVGSASGSDIQTVSFKDAQETAISESGITSEELEQSREVPQKIYDALAGDDSPNVLSLLKEIDDRLSESRVFYTSIVGASSAEGAVSQINSLSTSMSSSVTSSVTSSDSASDKESKTELSSESSSYNGKSSVFSEENKETMQELITTAVEIALRNIAGYSNGNGLPVTVTNMSTYGGM